MSGAPSGAWALFASFAVPVFVVAVMLAVTIAIAVVIAAPVIVTIVFAMAVARGIFPLVPIVADEVDGATTGIVLGAVFAPVSLVARRNVQVNRVRRHGNGRRL